MKIEGLFLHKKKVLYVIVMMAFFAVTVNFIRPAAETVFQATVAKSERKLPIYCVDTPEKKVSISFDAAWGNGKLRR